ncbi:FHA domain-containing protein [Polyangium jinanense]|uniref:FHA domain-containing protein n=1 Tax=Polyangium jinanense TaxID=2829994 RepID=A0A9X3XEK7_9BACT|nr:FHA domain-containing protein [Polyangium jinanense]MDC3961595.1 FHA domain-containing protein [Polyangium jinanense]MDC3987960.1 FHA domain-containing protein [Polyangium jinanense]
MLLAEGHGERSESVDRDRAIRSYPAHEHGLSSGAATHDRPGPLLLAPASDQGSTHGTFVNHSPVHSVQVRLGDRIVVGSTMLVIQDLDGPRFISYGYDPSLIDSQTGAYNRRHLDEQVSLELARQGSAPARRDGVARPHLRRAE